ncbi:MAG: hypothetical protein M3198_06480 [Actinomycetota bacterium]|nr:hypothetical protein [Actinomycetota bacterium]
MHKEVRGRTTTGFGGAQPRAATEEQKAAPLSPRKAFVLLTALILFATGALVITRPSPTSETDEVDLPPSTNFALTDEEATARFQELRDHALRATQSGNISLLGTVFTPNGPLIRRSQRIISDLQDNGVRDRINYVSLVTTVIQNGDNVIRIKERRLLHPCFTDAQGLDVTKDSTVVEQTVIWTMRRLNSEWKLHDGSLVRDKPLRHEHADCP